MVSSEQASPPRTAALQPTEAGCRTAAHHDQQEITPTAHWALLSQLAVLHPPLQLSVLYILCMLSVLKSSIANAIDITASIEFIQ
jgi:hypothetical protein